MTASNAASVSEAARRYAGALFSLANEKGELPSVAADLAALVSLAAESADLSRLLDSPAFAREQKVKALVDVAGKAGLSKTTVGFIGTMAQNGRASDIMSAATAFDGLYADHRGVKRAVAITAKEMTAKQRTQLEAVLAKAVGGDVELKTEVDTTIVGGIQLRIGSTLFDAGIASKLDRMNTAMKGA